MVRPFDSLRSLRAFDCSRMACHERSSRFAEGKRELSRMVEAAGVEPASENTSSQTTTCVSPFSCRNRLETEPSAPVAIPDMSHCHASGRNVAASPLNDDQSRAVGTLKLIAHRLLSGESVVCVRSYVVFPRDLRGAWASARVPRSRTPVEARSPPWRVRTRERLVQSTILFDLGRNRARRGKQPLFH